MNRFDQIHAVHMQDTYHLPELVPDVMWLRDMGQRGYVCLTQNPMMRYNAHEIGELLAHETKVFSLANAQYPLMVMGMVFGRNLMRIQGRSRRSGGCFWRVSEREPRRDQP